jgi:hypothetical protein
MVSHESPQYLVDQALSRRLERAEACANASFVEARARVFPNSGACWIDVAGAYAMFDGVGSPCTQTFGLGLFDSVGNDEMEKIEQFFKQRGAEVFHEVSPIADSSLLTLLNERGYKPCELSSVLFRPIEPGLSLSRAPGDSIRVRVIEPGEEELWAKVVARGWQDEAPELVQYLEDLAPIEAQRADTYSLLAEKEAEPIAAAAMCVFDGVALLAGACTVPEHRRQGAQLALLERRLQFGAEQGCDLAMMAAAPGSASQRNAERQGFRIAYTRIKWRLGPEKGKD